MFLPAAVGDYTDFYSSREHATLAPRFLGERAKIAKSFARIFFRNSFNMGLMIFESPSAVDAIKQGDTVEVDADQGIVRNADTGEVFKVVPIPPFMKELLADGGLIAHIRKLRTSEQASVD